MPRYEKYVNALFISASLLMGFIAKHYFQALSARLQLVRRIGPAMDQIEVLVVPVLVGVLTFTFLHKNVTTRTFTKDSVAELFHVSWPGSKEVKFGTLIVIVTVVLAGVFFGMLDIFLTHIVKTFLSF